MESSTNPKEILYLVVSLLFQQVKNLIVLFVEDDNGNGTTTNAATASSTVSKQQLTTTTTKSIQRNPLSQRTINKSTSRIPPTAVTKLPKKIAFSSSSSSSSIYAKTPKTPVKNVNQVIKQKNSFDSTYSSSSSIMTNKSHQPSTVAAAAASGTTKRRRQKPMPMSKRNEEQMQKFLQRQNKGRKDREQRLKVDEFAHLVRSPVRY